jgi:two-component system, NarL family, response regulator DegU
MKGSRITTMIIDSQAPVRRDLIRPLISQPDIIISEPDANRLPLEETEKKLVDVLFFGAESFNQGGIDLCRTIIRSHPDVKVFVITSKPDSFELSKLMKSAAIGGLNEGSALKEITDGRKQDASTENPVVESPGSSPQSAVNVLEKFETTPIAIDDRSAPLSRREQQILQFISNGNSNKRIAGVLEISEQTVKNHMTSIMRKLNANDRTHAVVLAIKLGLISIDVNEKVASAG